MQPLSRFDLLVIFVQTAVRKQRGWREDASEECWLFIRTLAEQWATRANGSLQALALSTASGAHRQPPGAAAAPLPDRSGGSRGLRGDAAEARGRQKGRGCEPLRRRSPPEPPRPRRCCLAQGTRRSSPREALTALIGSAQSRAAGCELLPSSHPSPRPPPPPPPGPQSPPAEPPSEQMPPVPNEADPEVPRMDPRILIFLLYVMILHELVSGWMEYQKQIAKPKKQAGPVWSSSRQTTCIQQPGRCRVMVSPQNTKPWELPSNPACFGAWELCALRVSPPFLG
ncbi:myosin-5 isoform X3 [Gallus gallus]|uniref:myosin-5 isoform X3 n=1 Tax=Gallus gallus TaxID=9031 RepID=UPI001AE6D7BE|nr:myosin-5 isoform X3 [Gallus gallus]